MSGKILITPRSLTKSGHPALKRIEAAGYEIVFSAAGRQPSEAELLQLVPGCVGWLAGVEPISARVLEAATDLKAISRNGTGVDAIDLDAAQRLGIVVLRADGANAAGVAELTLGLILALARAIPISDAKLKQGIWERVEGFEIHGKTLGLVGCGQIGHRVAQMALQLGLKVLAYDPIPSQQEGVQRVTLNEVFSAADIISLHCPPLPDRKPLIDGAALQHMKRGVYLVNSARAELLDDAAVLDALQSGQLAGLALDAYRAEPPGKTALLAHPRVIATPHIGAYTRESVTRAVEAAVDNLLEHLTSDEQITTKTQRTQRLTKKN